MAFAIFYMHQTSGMYAGICVCNRMHQMEKTAAIIKLGKSQISTSNYNSLFSKKNSQQLLMIRTPKSAVQCSFTSSN